MDVSANQSHEQQFSEEKSFDIIRSYVFHVIAKSSIRISSATAFTIGRLSKSNRLILVTAGHVLKYPKDEQIRWSIQQYDNNGQITRKIEMDFNESDGKDLPFQCHKQLDVGIMGVPNKDSVGKILFSDDELGLITIEDDYCVATGSRVCWAGYPVQVEKHLGFSQLCYFEGTVSATVDADNKRLYIVDGHNASGVSGGPVWYWSERNNRLEVVGIVSGYGHAEKKQSMPGFCVFEPINPIMKYIKTWNDDENSKNE